MSPSSSAVFLYGVPVCLQHPPQEKSLPFRILLPVRFFLFLFRFVFWSDFISDLWCGPSEALSFSYFFYNSPNSFQRKTRVFTKWSCGTREGRIRLCWTWRKQVRAFLNNPHHYFDNVWTSCLWRSFWNNILKYNDLTLFPKGYKAVLNEMFRVIGEFWLYFSSFCFLILAHRNGSLMLQGVNMTNERETPPLIKSD